MVNYTRRQLLKYTRDSLTVILASGIAPYYLIGCGRSKEDSGDSQQNGNGDYSLGDVSETTIFS